MDLFFMPGACSLAPHIVLREASLPFDLKQVSRQKKFDDRQDYLAVVSKGYVPALRLRDGTVITEGPAIVQYIADLAPDKKLLPEPRTLGRTQTQSWLNYISTELHKSCAPLFRTDISEPHRAYQLAYLHRQLRWTQDALGTRPYVHGDAFTVADAYLFTVLRWMPLLKIDMAPYAQLSRYMLGIGSRPAVGDALRAEGLKA
ncbi:MAG: glutathione transferase GstA [Deltaproteobacteria bacterium]|nr:MAG: glutathione transferase GstA [Deltaproteobacteria bacterium]